MIAEINEALSLSNEPGLMLNSSLDTLTAVMKVECCWLQTSDSAGLKLAACRGFTGEMQAEFTGLSAGSLFGKAVLGQGQSIKIPNLSNDGKYGLDSVRQAGFRWLVAVPLMTHRAQGILGVASGNPRRLDKDTADLLRTVGGLIGGALVKSRLIRQTPEPVENEIPEGSLNQPPLTRKTREPAPPPPDTAFQRHQRRMASFREKHG